MEIRYTILQQNDNGNELRTDNVTNKTPKSAWAEYPRTKAPTLSRKSRIISISITHFVLIIDTIPFAAQIVKPNKEKKPSSQATARHQTRTSVQYQPRTLLTLSTQRKKNIFAKKEGCMEGMKVSVGALIHSAVAISIQRELRRCYYYYSSFGSFISIIIIITIRRGGRGTKLRRKDELYVMYPSSKGELGGERK